jgi:hypothetical protein
VFKRDSINGTRGVCNATDTGTEGVAAVLFTKAAVTSFVIWETRLGRMSERERVKEVERFIIICCISSCTPAADSIEDSFPSSVPLIVEEVDSGKNQINQRKREEQRSIKYEKEDHDNDEKSNKD